MQERYGLQQTLGTKTAVVINVTVRNEGDVMVQFWRHLHGRPTRSDNGTVIMPQQLWTTPQKTVATIVVIIDGDGAALRHVASASVD